MDPITWLERIVGFKELPERDRKAISDFALLWSLLEGTLLGTFATAAGIVQAVDGLEGAGQLDATRVAPALAYFRDRYFAAGAVTENFVDLRFRDRDRRDLVEEVMAAKDVSPAGEVKAVLIIAFRLRNNLFHGVKWGYRMKGQLANFENANDVLMAVMEMYGPYEQRPEED